MRAQIGVALLLVAAGCAGPPPATEPPTERDVEIVRGSGYHKSVYEHHGETVVSFNVEVSNEGTDAGSSKDPRCHVTIDGEIHRLDIFQNPELEPGEKGLLRTGGTIPPPSHGEVDDLDVFCAL